MPPQKCTLTEARVKVLYEQALAQHKELGADVYFISAEKYVKEIDPGKYDEVIDKAYRSEEAQKRIASEAKGLEDIRAGRYAVGEFQLEKRDKK